MSNENNENNNENNNKRDPLDDDLEGQSKNSNKGYLDDDSLDRNNESDESNNDGNNDNKGEHTDHEEEKLKQARNLSVGNKIIRFIEMKLGMLKFLDTVKEEPFELGFNNKFYEMYKKNFETPLLNIEDVDTPINLKKRELKRNYEVLGIADAVSSIKKNAENIMLKNNIKSSIAKRVNKINMAVSGVMFGILLVIMLLGQKAGVFGNVLLFIVLMLYCTLPQILRKKYLTRWNNFKFEHLEELQSRLKDEFSRIKEFNQLLIDTTIDFMLENKIPLQVVQFQLYSNDYKNINIIREQIQNQREVYLVKLEYPEGVEPLEIPATLSVEDQNVHAERPINNEVVEDDSENDLFILLRPTEYNDDGTIKPINQKYVALSDKEKIEAILDDCTFKQPDFPPEKLIRNFHDNKEFKCGCGTPLNFEEIQEATYKGDPSKSFYLVIAHKCHECGNNPFIIFDKKGQNFISESSVFFI